MRNAPGTTFYQSMCADGELSDSPLRAPVYSDTNIDGNGLPKSPRMLSAGYVAGCAPHDAFGKAIKLCGKIHNLRLNTIQHINTR
jgi:hypothetical protein